MKVFGILIAGKKSAVNRMYILRPSVYYILLPEYCCHLIQVYCCIAIWDDSGYPSHMDTSNLPVACFLWDCWQKQQDRVRCSLSHNEVSQRGSTNALVSWSPSPNGNGWISSLQCDIYRTILHICKCVGPQNLHHIQHPLYNLHYSHNCHCFHHCGTDLLSISI